MKIIKNRTLNITGKIRNYILYFFMVCCVFACEDYLDVVPDNIATLDYAFRDRISAERYLISCYNYLPYFGRPNSDPGIMGGDDVWMHRDPYYPTYYPFTPYRLKEGLQNSDNPLLDYWSGANYGRPLFRGIRDCNIFLENIDKVGPDLRPAERTRWKAEVTFLKAYYHYYLLRMYGPIPLIRENLLVGAGIEEVRVYRDPFDDCVDYIVELLDKAAEDLPPSVLDRNNELGRITSAIALAVKAELLVMAASPLFNGNPDFAGMIDNRGVSLFKSEADPTKWTRAANACLAAIQLCEAERHRLYEFPAASNYELSETTRRVLSCRHVVWDRWNTELIWATSVSVNSQDHQWLHLPFFTTVEAGAAQGMPCLSPTLRMAEMFYSARGIPIDEDPEYDYDNRYKTALATEDQKYYIQPGFETAILNMNREPRFYANLGFDGGVWFGNGRFRDVDNGAANETPWILEMKRGQASGNYNGLRFSVTGYWAKKASHFETSRTTDGRQITYSLSSYPIIRLADLYLLYSEALNESLDSPTEEVYIYIDKVRARAGLDGVVESWKRSRISDKPATKEGMRSIIRQERNIELAFEGKRFWDIRRWKIASEVMNQPVRGWNYNGSSPAEYYNVITLDVPRFTTKEYLWPIRDSELRTNKNLIPNPGWE